MSHMCDEWYGRVSEPGGGLYILNNPFSESPSVTDLISKTPVQNGRYKGKILEPGAFVTPEVTYDGRTIYFAYSANKQSFYELRWNKEKKYNTRKEYFANPDTAYHLFKIDADGKNLMMMTDGKWNDFDPCELPNGRICFLTERHGGEGRCHPRPCPAYIMYSMLPDGSDIEPLSYHEINEWSPTVTNDGKIIYSRWDYVDRVNSHGQHPWIALPDGRDPRALYGNYEGGGGSVQADLRPVPESPLFFGTMYGHHASSWGTLTVYDSRIVDDGTKNCWTYLTPDIPGYRGKENRGAYATPFPLSEKYYLCVWSPDARTYSLIGLYSKPEVPHGVYLADAFGNKTLLYRDPDISCNGPFPLRPRKKPVVLPHSTATGLPPGIDKPPVKTPADKAVVAVMDVYNSKLPWPEGRKIKALRIVHIFPKTTPSAGSPPIAYDGEFVAREVLGTVPVESDGSAHFIMPAAMSIYFQALDENGLAIQSMRTSTYAMPGETMTCQGCHEPKGKSPKSGPSLPMALKRPPSKIKPGPEGTSPMTFPNLIQPVLDAKCVACHEKNSDKTFSLKANGKVDPRVKKKELGWKYHRHFTTSYSNLLDYAWCYNERRGRPGPKNKKWGAEGSTGDRSVPGEVGAYVSKLYNILTTGSHKDRVELSPVEMEKIVTWLDCMSVFYGAYEDTHAQKKGEVVVPKVQ